MFNTNNRSPAVKFADVVNYGNTYQFCSTGTTDILGSTLPAGLLLTQSCLTGKYICPFHNCRASRDSAAVHHELGHVAVHHACGHVAVSLHHACGHAAVFEALPCITHAAMKPSVTALPCVTQAVTFILGISQKICMDCVRERCYIYYIYIYTYITVMRMRIVIVIDCSLV